MLAAAAVRNMNEHYAFAVGFIVNNQDESRSTGTREQTERRDNKKRIKIMNTCAKKIWILYYKKSVNQQYEHLMNKCAHLQWLGRRQHDFDVNMNWTGSLTPFRKSRERNCTNGQKHQADVLPCCTCHKNVIYRSVLKQNTRTFFIRAKWKQITVTGPQELSDKKHGSALKWTVSDYKLTGSMHKVKMSFIMYIVHSENSTQTVPKCKTFRI